jgi:hypothetical protein
MAQTNITIINKALSRIGAPTITSLDDGSREAEVMNELYESTYQSLLVEAPWTFARKDLELSQNVVDPIDQNFQYSYLLPTDYINIISFYSSGGSTEKYFSVQGDYVYSNLNRLFAKYIYQPSETELPAWFTNYLIVKLAYVSTEAIIGIGSVQDRLEKELYAVRAAAFKQDNALTPRISALAPSKYVSVRG